MQLNPDELRQQYDRLSDEALLEVVREDLVDMARDIYDAELSQRGLTRPVEEAAPPEPEPEAAAGLVVLAEFASFIDASLAQAALTSAGIPSSIKETGPYGSAAGQPTILVPRESLEDARAVLDSPLSDDELAAQAEAAGQPEE
jgi:hypothetical protein